MGIGLILGKVKYNVIKYSPEILITSGVVLGVGAVAAASMKAPELMEAKEVAKSEKDIIEINLENLRAGKLEKGAYSEKKYAVESKAIKIRSFLRYCNALKVPITMELLSVIFIGFGFGILRSRYYGVSAALAATAAQFEAYRKRVVEKEGSEADILYFQGLDEESDAKGKKKKAKKDALTPFQVVFSSKNPGWDDDRFKRYMYLKNMERIFTDKLRHNFYVTVNQVREALGEAPTTSGQLFGWIYDGSDKDCACCVQFDLDSPINEDFVNGKSPTALLTFNVNPKPIWTDDRIFKDDREKLV